MRIVLDALEAEGERTEEVRELCAFLRRSGEGEHGRYLESQRKG
jgi:hypothetical protein